MDEPSQFILLVVVDLNSVVHSDLTSLFDENVSIRGLLIGQGEIHECSLTAVGFKWDV